MNAPDEKATKDEKHCTEEKKSRETKYEKKNLLWKESNAQVLTCKLN